MLVNSIKTKNNYHNYIVIKQSDNTSTIELLLCGASGSILSDLNQSCTLTILDEVDQLIRQKTTEQIVNGTVTFRVTNDLKTNPHTLEITTADGRKFPSNHDFKIFVSYTHDESELKVINNLSRDEALAEIDQSVKQFITDNSPEFIDKEATAKWLNANEFKVKDPVATKASLSSDAELKELRLVVDENKQYLFNGLKWIEFGAVNADGLSQLRNNLKQVSILAREYGAVANSSENMSTQIQAAIDAAFALGGGTVVLENGKYNANIIVKDNVILKTSGGKAYFNAVTTGTVIDVPGLNARVLDIFVDGAYASDLSVPKATHAFKVTGKGSKLERVSGFRTRYDSLYLSGGSFLAIDCIFTQATRNTVSIVNGKDYKFNNCYFYQNADYTGLYLFDIEPDAPNNVDDVIFESCTFESDLASGGNLILKNSSPGTEQNITLLNCKFKKYANVRINSDNYKGLTIHNCTFENFMLHAVNPLKLLSARITNNKVKNTYNTNAARIAFNLTFGSSVYFAHNESDSFMGLIEDGAEIVNNTGAQLLTKMVSSVAINKKAPLFQNEGKSEQIGDSRQADAKNENEIFRAIRYVKLTTTSTPILKAARRGIHKITITSRDASPGGANIYYREIIIGCSQDYATVLKDSESKYVGTPAVKMKFTEGYSSSVDWKLYLAAGDSTADEFIITVENYNGTFFAKEFELYL
ncbi:hypothetical protein [Macrococcoides canis]|uniref:hypothetical protein n=1 Tax=Macrococcoides canis TaxID=1855823 RepID=UPI0020B71ABA|nr:hypothetical protein [Macrococcus canis]UTH05758.1 hypothetical protein KFV07_06045 [Macrococcus canis]